METLVLSRPITLFGRLMTHCFPYRKKVILSNIEQAFGEQISPKAKQHLLSAFYSHLGRTIRETLTLRFLSEVKMMEKVDVIGHEHLQEVADAGQGILILTGHFGNWEFAPLAGMMQFKDFNGSFHFIRKSIGFKFIEDILFKRYLNAGLRIINKTHALQKITAALEQNHGVVFVLDQHASLVNKDGVAADFFGKKAGTYRSLAMISHYTKVPVVPAQSYRTESGKHVLKFYPPLPLLDGPNPVYENTLQYNQALEKMIMAHPEQWWWLHKRWKI